MVERVKVNGASIAYEMHGEGEPLLLIHGAGIDRTEWKPQHEALGKHYRLLIPDVRGHGESEQTTAPYSMKLFADDMIGLLDALGIEQVLVCGHSMGGTIAQQMVADYPKRVRALVLAETNYGTKSNRMLWLAGKSIAIILRLVSMKRLVRMTAQMAKTPEGQAMVEAAFAPHVANPANFRNIAEANNEFDGKAQLSRIQCPTLVIIAEKNRATHGMGRYMGATIPGAGLVTIPNAGHLVNWDNTQAFNAAVLEFFEKVTHGS